MVAVSITLVIIIIYISKSKTNITVQTNPELNLLMYKNAFIDVQHDEYRTTKEKRNGPEVFWIKEQIEKNLKNFGFEYFSFGQINQVPDKSDMIVKCHITDGLGIPKLTRHFRIEFQFTKTIDIEFIDATNHNVIAKISYVRGFADSHDGDVDKIFFELKKKLDKGTTDGTNMP